MYGLTRYFKGLVKLPFACQLLRYEEPLLPEVTFPNAIDCFRGSAAPWVNGCAAVTFMANAVFPKRKSQNGRKTLYRVFGIS